MQTEEEKRAAYLLAKRMLAQPATTGTLFDEDEAGLDLLRRGVLVRLIQRQEPIQESDDLNG